MAQLISKPKFSALTPLITISQQTHHLYEVPAQLSKGCNDHWAVTEKKALLHPLAGREANAEDTLFQKLVCSKLKIQNRLSYTVLPFLSPYIQGNLFSFVVFFTVVSMEAFLTMFAWVRKYNTGFLNKHSLFSTMIKLSWSRPPSWTQHFCPRNIVDKVCMF